MQSCNVYFLVRGLTPSLLFCSPLWLIKNCSYTEFQTSNCIQLFKLVCHMNDKTHIIIQESLETSDIKFYLDIQTYSNSTTEHIISSTRRYLLNLSRFYAPSPRFPDKITIPSNKAHFHKHNTKHRRTQWSLLCCVHFHRQPYYVCAILVSIVDDYIAADTWNVMQPLLFC